MKKSFSKHPFVYTAIAVIIIIILGFIIFKKSSSNYETLVVTRKDFRMEVSASGRVVAHDRADLGFEQNGKISNVYVKVDDLIKKGSPIASIENSDLKADLAQKQAVLAREEAKLVSLEQGTRPEQLAIDNQNFLDASRSLIVAMQSAHVTSEGAIQNYIDTIFTNGSSVNPTILLQTQSYSEQSDINNTRIQVTEKLKSWKNSLANLSNTSSIESISSAKKITIASLDLLKSFTDKMSNIANNNYVSNSGLSQTTIDNYKNTINTASSIINNAAQTFQTADTAWNKSLATLNLSKAGATTQDIMAQSAQVDSALADVSVAKSKLSKSIITAPFDGTITKADGKIGEIVSPNTSLFSIMNTSSYEIESYIPEVHIANILSGNKVFVTLDAYGPDVIFDATVTSIDPAETIRDGVSTYKVTMKFNEDDKRIKSGMTASVKIITKEQPNTIVVPQGFIKTEGNQKYVTILKDDQKIITPVITDGLSALGQSDIVEGLQGGETIIIEKNN